MFKMTTLKRSGVTIIWFPGYNVIKIFPELKNALAYMELMRTLYYRRTRRNVASEPYPVRSLIPNLSTRKCLKKEV